MKSGDVDVLRFKHLLFWCLGMGVPTVTAARILKGQLNGQSGEETQLEMDKFPFVSLAKVRLMII